MGVCRMYKFGGTGENSQECDTHRNISFLQIKMECEWHRFDLLNHGSTGILLLAKETHDEDIDPVWQEHQVKANLQSTTPKIFIKTEWAYNTVL